MRYALLLALCALSCAAEPVLLPDASTPDAGPCGGACGAGTVCMGGSCVAVDAGGAMDAGAPDAGPVDAGEDRPVVVDAGSDGGAADVEGDAGPTDAGATDTGPVDVPPMGCVDGGCAECAPGLTRCGGSCALLGSDARNCGACGTVCAIGAHATGVACRSGVCAPTCTVGFANCDGISSNGCEASLETDARNCGACGNACAPRWCCRRISGEPRCVTTGC
mgnify:FL=1